MPQLNLRRLLCRVGLHAFEFYIVVDNSTTGCGECSRCGTHLAGHPDCKLWQRELEAGTMSREVWVTTHTPSPRKRPDLTGEAAPDSIGDPFPPPSVIESTSRQTFRSEAVIPASGHEIADRDVTQG